MKLKIYILTNGRVGKQKTLRQLSEELKKRTWLVVQYSERKLHDYPRILVLPKKIKSIAPTREYVLKNAEAKKIIMLDDDLQFYKRKNLKDWHLKPLRGKKLIRLFNWVEKNLDKYVHVGVSGRSGNNRVKENSKIVGSARAVLAFNTSKVKKLGVRFDRLRVMEDKDITLQLLRKGYANKISYFYAFGQTDSNSKGGCSVFRTPRVQTKTANKLAKLHKGFVTVVEKTTLSSWKNEFGNKRTDVIVRWKKAFESSQ